MPPTTLRRQRSAFAARSIHKLRNLPCSTSCNPPPREKLLKHWPEPNGGKVVAGGSNPTSLGLEAPRQTHLGPRKSMGAPRNSEEVFVPFSCIKKGWPV